MSSSSFSKRKLLLTRKNACFVRKNVLENPPDPPLGGMQAPLAQNSKPERLARVLRVGFAPTRGGKLVHRDGVLGVAQRRDPVTPDPPRLDVSCAKKRIMFRHSFREEEVTNM